MSHFEFPCPIDGASSLGVLFLLTAVAGEQNTKLPVQQGVAKLLTSLFNVTLKDTVLTLKLVADDRNFDVVVQNNQVDIRMWTLVLARLGWRKRLESLSNCKTVWLD
jgi:hypothetical protein